ncbi:MAG: glutaredoxin family protein [Rhodocyclaceae bacterium]|nr:glutaredoxin family protein [Rhodocyclaceae bacterium]
MGAAPVLTLYWREYCHLCHDMLAQLLALHEQLRTETGAGPLFEVEIRDVDADPVLEARYDELVPVLTADAGKDAEKELCHYFLNPDSVRAYLAEIR